MDDKEIDSRLSGIMDEWFALHPDKFIFTRDDLMVFAKKFFMSCYDGASEGVKISKQLMWEDFINIFLEGNSKSSCPHRIESILIPEKSYDCFPNKICIEYIKDCQRIKEFKERHGLE